MKYFAFENIRYKTKLSSEEILKRLGEVIEPKKSMRMNVFFGKSNHKAYEGSIDGNTFNINRIICYRNSFLPRIKGIIENDISGTIVNVKMRLHTFVKVFMFIWFGGVGLAFIAFLLNSISSEKPESLGLMPLGMLIFGYAMVTLGFKFESIKSKKYLADLFEAEMEE